MYDKQFRRLTDDRIRNGVTAGKPLIVEGAVRGSYVATWVVPKREFDAFNREAMDTYLNLMFETDIARVQQLFPNTYGELDLGKLRQLMGDFVIVGRTSTWLALGCGPLRGIPPKCSHKCRFA